MAPTLSVAVPISHALQLPEMHSECSGLLSTADVSAENSTSSPCAETQQDCWSDESPTPLKRPAFRIASVRDELNWIAQRCVELSGDRAEISMADLVQVAVTEGAAVDRTSALALQKEMLKLGVASEESGVLRWTGSRDAAAGPVVCTGLRGRMQSVNAFDLGKPEDTPFVFGAPFSLVIQGMWLRSTSLQGMSARSGAATVSVSALGGGAVLGPFGALAGGVLGYAAGYAASTFQKRCYMCVCPGPESEASKFILQPYDWLGEGRDLPKSVSYGAPVCLKDASPGDRAGRYLGLDSEGYITLAGHGSRSRFFLSSPGRAGAVNGGDSCMLVLADRTHDQYGTAVSVHRTTNQMDWRLYAGIWESRSPSAVTIVPQLKDRDVGKHVSPRALHVSVMVYNVWFMPPVVTGFLGPLTGMSLRKKTRAAKLAPAIAELKSDVVILAEAFCPTSTAILVSALKSKGYPFDSPVVGCHGTRWQSASDHVKPLNGGVLAVSAHPIEAAFCRTFSDQGLVVGEDLLADKGVLYVRIRKQGRPVHIFASHTGAWDTDSATQARFSQLESIRKWIDELSIPSSDPVIIAGDLNVNYFDIPAHGRMLDLLQANDPFAETIPREETHPEEACEQAPLKQDSQVSQGAEFSAPVLEARYSFDSLTNGLAGGDSLSTDGSRCLVDYVLVSSNHLQPTYARVAVEPLKDSEGYLWKGKRLHDLSDHYPVLGDFRFPLP